MFASERFGKPQVLAVLLLLALLGQCLLLMARNPMTNVEAAYVGGGHGGPQSQAESRHSRLVSLMATAPTHLFAAERWGWAPRLPFVLVGLLLGASLWYVSRRLYGNSGGYIALTLYCFSPIIVTRSSSVNADIVAAWGAFGAIFTGIAVSHTLYAPREVVLWNWRRILLLGVAIGVGVGAQFSVVISVPIALAFMFYLVPHRRGAALVILGASCAVALAILVAVYAFHFPALWSAVREAKLLAVAPHLLASPVTYTLLGRFFLRNSPAMVALLVLALVAYAAWGHTRFFGTTAPLLLMLVFLALGIAMPHQAGFSFLVIALPFAFVFISGVCADLLETRYSGLVLGIIAGILVAHAFFSLGALLSFP
jgi:Dolichyl-phosphate-mannose-protein mannosyltransferase